MKTLRLLPLALLAALAPLAPAWNAAGHMVIAAVADRGLTPAVRAEVARLAVIGARPDDGDPYGAAVWADDVRPDRPESAPWHYITLTFRRDGAPLGVRTPEDNVVSALRRFTAVLGDRKRPDAERAEALRYVMHFVGDVHQPLHATTLEDAAHPEGDRGGNETKLRPAARFAGMERPPTNLHALWDFGGGLFPAFPRPLTPETAAEVRRQGDTLIATLPAEGFPERRETDPMKWAEESHALGVSVGYAVEAGSEPSEAYLAKVQAVSARRAALAGYRLADLLNRTLG